MFVPLSAIGYNNFQAKHALAKARGVPAETLKPEDGATLKWWADARHPDFDESLFDAGNIANIARRADFTGWERGMKSVLRVMFNTPNRASESIADSVRVVLSQAATDDPIDVPASIEAYKQVVLRFSDFHDEIGRMKSKLMNIEIWHRSIAGPYENAVTTIAQAEGDLQRWRDRLEVPVVVDPDLAAIADGDLTKIPAGEDKVWWQRHASDITRQNRLWSNPEYVKGQIDRYTGYLTQAKDEAARIEPELRFAEQCLAEANKVLNPYKIQYEDMRAWCARARAVVRYLWSRDAGLQPDIEALWAWYRTVIGDTNGRMWADEVAIHPSVSEYDRPYGAFTAAVHGAVWTQIINEIEDCTNINAYMAAHTVASSYFITHASRE